MIEPTTIEIDLLPDDDKMTREGWLLDLVQELGPRLEAVELEVPKGTRISTGWPSVRGTSSRNRVVGECWRKEAAADGAPQIFISPMLVDSIDVAAVTLHEMIHAAGRHGHRAEFSQPARQLGLKKPWTGTTPGDLLRAELAKLIERIGPYPHADLRPGMGPVKKQGTRMLKVSCPRCEYTARIAQKWIDTGLPTCPCGREMEVV